MSDAVATEASDNLAVGSTATAADLRSLILQAEALLFKRLDATADPAERRSLKDQIEALNNQKDDLNVDVLIRRAEVLNRLTDVLVGALAGIRTQPLDGIGTAIEALVGQIGSALGPGQIRAIPHAAEPPPDVQPQRGQAVPESAPGAPPASTPFAREYAELFDSCEIRPERLAIVQSLAARAAANALIYQKVSDAVGGRIPWFFIAIVHGLESTFSFETHLHNGDPLTARTVRTPAGRPAAGAPPFSWHDSAVDALRFEGLADLADWSVADMLGRWEKFNGFGYRSHHINSPYLWSFSNQYTCGKFIRDKVFDPDAVSNQAGAAVLLKALVSSGAAVLDGPGKQSAAPSAAPASVAAVLGAGPAALLPRDGLSSFVSAEIDFPGAIGRDSDNANAIRRVQEWCTFHRQATPIDGDFGAATENAVRAFQAKQGLPDTGAVDPRTWAALTAPMLRALAPVRNAPPGLPGMLVALARQHLLEHPLEVGGDNRGPWVRLYMTGHDGADQQWCAGFLCFLVQQAASQSGVGMPWRRQVGCGALVADAKREGRFIAGDALITQAARTTRLPPGTVFALRHATQPPDYFHTGLVTEARADSFSTVEGNTNQTGSSLGFEVTQNSRAYRNVDFLTLA